MSIEIPQDPKIRALIEGAKELGRLALFFAISWLLTETLNQLELVPQFVDVQVWVFTYSVPARLLSQLGLTAALRFVDKYKFVKSKEDIEIKKQATPEGQPEPQPSGLAPF